MDDPITSDEPVPQNIFRPNSVGFRFLEHTPGSPTGSIRVFWSNSSSDRQANFEGYVVRLLGRDSSLQGSTWITRTFPIQEKIVDKTIFEVVFDNVLVGEDYILAVWGKAFSKPNDLDSLLLSRDSAVGFTERGEGIIFDPRPLENPTALRAASVGENSVRLEWDNPGTHSQTNLGGYFVYYRDPSRLNDSAKFLQYVAPLAAPWTVSFVNVPAPLEQIGTGNSNVKEYEYWVKAVRRDSAQFYDDSTLIRWSGGARVVPDSINGSVRFGQGLEIGNLNGRVGAREADPNAASAWIRFDEEGENIRITGLKGTRFFAEYHGASELDTAIFSAPLETSQYSEESITVPKSSPRGGWMFYAKLPDTDDPKSFVDGNPVRLRIRGAIGGSVVINGDRISLELIYQPKRGDAAPLPYF